MDINLGPESNASAGVQERIRQLLGLGSAARLSAEQVTPLQQVVNSLRADHSLVAGPLHTIPLDGNWTYLGVTYAIYNGVGSVLSSSYLEVYPDQALNLNVPFPVTNINNGAFKGSFSGNLAGHLNLPSGLVYIGVEAFDSCSSLTGVTFPSTVAYIDDRAFYGCGGLGELVFPESLLIIGDSAFKFCSGNHARIVIPMATTEINTNAFAFCWYVGEFLIPGTPDIGEDILLTTNVDRLYVGGDASAYASAGLDPAHQPVIYYKPGTLGWQDPEWSGFTILEWTSYPHPMP